MSYSSAVHKHSVHAHWYMDVHMTSWPVNTELPLETKHEHDCAEAERGRGGGEGGAVGGGEVGDECVLRRRKLCSAKQGWFGAGVKET